MIFQDPLLTGNLVRRYKRFFAEIVLSDGESITAHCPNSGSMLSILESGSTVWVSRANNPKRKLKYTWELTQISNVMIGVNTNHPNKLAEEAICRGTIKELQDYKTLRREVKYGKNSRIDILLERENGSKCFVEVKNVTMKRNTEVNGVVEFPDGVTTRGAKHLDELSQMVSEGHRSVMLFLVQRNDCASFKLARDIDPTYGRAYDQAKLTGVEFISYACQVTPEKIDVTKQIALLE